MLWRLLFLSFCVENCVPQIKYSETNPVIYEIAGIFEEDSVIQSMAFDESSRNAHLQERQLRPIVLQANRPDSYSVWRELCKNKSIRPVAIVGPQNPVTDGAVREQCAVANIPHLQAAWQPFDPELELNEEEEPEEKEEQQTDEETDQDNEETPPTFKKITINYYPDSNEITTAYAKLLKYYRWEKFAALYEDDYGLMRIQKILAEHTDKFPVAVRQLDPNGDNYYKVFKEISKYQDSRILLDCDVKNLPKYMRICDSLNMTNPYQHYILVSMDTSIVVDTLKAYSSNFTWFSLTEYDKLVEAQHYLAPRVGTWTPVGGSPSVAEFQLEALMIDDLTNHVLQALRSIEIAEEKEEIDKPQNSVCERDAPPWNYGAVLQNTILNTQSIGVTGNIQFDEMGRRINYTLHVNEIYMKKRRTIGSWNSALDGNIVENEKHAEEDKLLLNNKHFIVISRKAKPYFYPVNECTDENCDPKEPQEYEGFSVDLVKAIFEQLKKENYTYTYEFVLVEDQSYGTFNPKIKKWTGLIGYLLDKKADLAVCDLTITEERKTVVDFSVPIMSLGISILFTQEGEISPGMFSFLNPYSLEVWLYIATAYCVVSIILFICARISTADWENPQPCDKDPEELENIWNFKNCAWLTMGSIMTQGCDILPKGFGTRWVCGMWWFFSMIVAQTYIAQLSASMTTALTNEPINNIEDLANQNKILYGALKDGSTYQFFKKSKDKVYRTIYENMEANPAVMVDNNDEGEKRVVNGRNKYAFFMESSTIDYKMRRNCQLKKVGDKLDSKDYGIAMPANSPFRSNINRAILKLKELTTLDNITNLWWTQKYGAKQCDDDKKSDNDVEGDLEIDNLIGAFLVLIMGLIFSLFITAAEFMNEVQNIVVREQVTHKEAFYKELKASLNFYQLQKPVLRNPSRAPSVAISEKRVTEDKQSRRAELIENFLDFEKQTQ